MEILPFTGTPAGVGPVSIGQHLQGYLEGEKAAGFLYPLIHLFIKKTFSIQFMKIRVGFGFDVHQLVEGRELWLGGVLLEHTKGLLGHSDATCLLHAVCDASLGSGQYA